MVEKKRVKDEGWREPSSQIKRVRKSGRWYQIEMVNGTKLIAVTVQEFREPRKATQEV